ncbi:S-adenosyl-L-methionine-dependent methyltransferase [Aspergillus leporis]|uniref:S-adenosyl-L-methionine-dependent methyltransferase n=1 Tax=Aspergillus leporis TaxID=41062 RepID=A0A5N5WSR2_9EURO|nr:S-adenosyl-L-methionine-dependent methyltransferase [Aspergillus leporis]
MAQEVTNLEFVETDPELRPDSDSDCGESISSERTSLRSSIMNYYYENGRRYHAYHAGSYWGPNDERAIEQLDIGPHVFNLLEGRLYLAPIPENIQRVLDIGTGTGIWAIEFADMHPSATVIGTDLSPIQSTWVPPNVLFEIDDCCDDWVYRKNSFDFAHLRGLYGCIADWDKFYEQALEHLKPGGYVEQAEVSVVPKSTDGSTDNTIFEE